ncbi:DUF3618 domain-containing protein [Saccharopolyspora shandongensis]|uniref:DUF3618 domain-containing protein n=1 Tax=Saccharopolyspora shandongensis TaxID=418495 RepID=UPI0033CAEC3C
MTGRRQEDRERAGLRAEHDLTLHELGNTLDELVHRADIRGRSRRALHDAVARTGDRAARLARGTAKPLLALALVAGGVIAYAMTRMLRRSGR